MKETGLDEGDQIKVGGFPGDPDLSDLVDLYLDLKDGGYPNQKEEGLPGSTTAH